MVFRLVAHLGAREIIAVSCLHTEHSGRDEKRSNKAEEPHGEKGSKNQENFSDSTSKKAVSEFLGCENESDVVALESELLGARGVVVCGGD